MKSVSVLALATAIAFSVPAPTFAQDVNGAVSGAVDATTGAGVSAGVGDTSVDAEVDVDVDASATVEGDLDGDGVLSDDEQDALDEQLDTDGDGSVSDEERAAGASATASTTLEDSDGACPSAEYTGSAEISADDLAVLSAAATAQFIIVDDCDLEGSLVSEGSSAAGSVQAAVYENQSLAAELSARGVGTLLGVSIEGDAVTIYAEENEGDDDSAAQTSTTGSAAPTGEAAGAQVEAGVDATVQAQ